MKTICDKKNPSIFPSRTVQYSTVQYSTVQYSAVQCSAVQCSAVQCSAVQCSAVQYSTVQCSTVRYSTVQYGTVQYSNNPMVWYRTKIYVAFSFFVCKTHSRLILHTSYYTLTCSISCTYSLRRALFSHTNFLGAVEGSASSKNASTWTRPPTTVQSTSRRG